MKLIIIGAGPGGYHTATYAAQHGMEVIIIEKEHAGGTCLNCGCIPTKTLCHEAEVIETVREFTGSMPEVDFDRIMERKQKVIEQLRNGVEGLMAAPGITFVRGKARLKDAHTVVVDEEEYTADHIIIATGSHAKLPPIEGIDHKGVMTSTELLNIDHVPQRLCIVGAGVIGMEFASVFRSLGSEVTVIEFMKECLPVLNSDIAKRLRKEMEKRGIEFHMQSAVSRISEEGKVKSEEFESKNLIVEFSKVSKKASAKENSSLLTPHSSLTADVVLIATGREPNTADLGLEDVGIDYDRKGIKVDDNMQTNIPGVYAIGDVNGRMMLAHAASAQGMRCVNHILGKADKIRLDIMPSAVFTSPEAASVGLTEEQCDTQGIEYTSQKTFYRANGKALAINATEGMVKLLADTSSKIIGCHIYGAHAADLIQEVTAVMNYDGTLSDLHDIIHTHPTLSEVLIG